MSLKFRFPFPSTSPFIAMGPSLSFRLTGDKNHYAGTMVYSARNVATSWNFTGGIDIMRTVQLSLTYNLGITDYYRAYPYGINHAASAYGVRSNTWMFSAAVLF